MFFFFVDLLQYFIQIFVTFSQFETDLSLYSGTLLKLTSDFFIELLKACNEKIFELFFSGICKFSFELLSKLFSSFEI